jgi:hypothetical protein
MLVALLGLTLSVADTHALLVEVGDAGGVAPPQDLSAAVDAVRGTLLPGVDAVTVLRGAEATLPRVRKALTALEAAASPGDRVFVYYTGHGTTLPDEDGDETDGVDEAWVLHGSRVAPSPRGLLVDDEIGRRVSSLRRAVGSEGEVVLVVDACYSGGSARGGAALAVVRPSVIAAGQDGGTGIDAPAGEAPFVFLAAARADEPADTFRDRRMGVFTHLATATMRTPFAPDSWRGLVDHVQVAAARSGSAQRAQLEGDGGLGVLGVATPDRAFVRVVAQDGRTLTLGSGRLHGLEAGATVSLVMPGKVDDVVTTATVTEASVLQARAEVVVAGSFVHFWALPDVSAAGQVTALSEAKTGRPDLAVVLEAQRLGEAAACGGGGALREDAWAAEVAMRQGDAASLRVRHAGQTDAYLTVVAHGPSGSVELVWPNGVSGDARRALRPGRSWTLPICLSGFDVPGTWVLRAIATPHPLPVVGLAGARGGAEEPAAFSAATLRLAP